VHDHAHEQANDLLALGVGQPGVKAVTEPCEGVRGQGGLLRTLCGLQSRHAAFQLGLVVRDPVELEVEFVIGHAAPDAERERLLALLVEGSKRPGERDRCDGGNGALALLLRSTIDFVEQVTRENREGGRRLVARVAS
jgi:hypothetical protein